MAKRLVKRYKGLKPIYRFLLAFIILACLFTSVFLMQLSLKKEKSQGQELLYTYNINQNLDYKVYLYDNSFIDEPYLKSGQMYVSDLVKNINVTFLFNYSGTKNVNLDYNYKIDGEINGEYPSTTSAASTEDTKVWNKSYTFLDTQTKHVNNSPSFTINEDLNIDFSQYNKEVITFKNQLGLPINASLKVTMTININGISDGNKINDEKKIILDIPLGKQAFSITEDYKKTDSTQIFNTIEKIKALNTTEMKIGIAIFGLAIMLFIVSFKAIFNIQKKTKYNRELDKILKDYGEIIVEVVDPIIVNDLDIINVKNIEEMIDLEEELRIPITFYEEIPNKKGIFIIVHNNIIYQYTLLDEEN